MHRHRSSSSRHHRSSSSRHHHHHQRRNAFVAARNVRGDVMVVQDRRTGKWMLPGGRVERGESSERGAVREMWEETGNHPSEFLRHVQSRNGTSLYETRLRPGSRSDRMRRFHRRPDKHETADYGFVNVRGPKFVVTDHRGRVKNSNPVSFRHGTVSHLSSLRAQGQRRRAY